MWILVFLDLDHMFKYLDMQMIYTYQRFFIGRVNSLNQQP